MSPHGGVFQFLGHPARDYQWEYRADFPTPPDISKVRATPTKPSLVNPKHFPAGGDAALSIPPQPNTVQSDLERRGNFLPGQYGGVAVHRGDT